MEESKIVLRNKHNCTIKEIQKQRDINKSYLRYKNKKKSNNNNNCIHE